MTVIGSKRIVFSIVTLVLCLQFSLSAVAADTDASSNQTTQVSGLTISSGVLYSVEFRKTCGPPHFPSSIGQAFITTLINNGVSCINGGTTLLKSVEHLEYSTVATQAETSLRRGFLFAEVGAGSELTFKSDKEQEVVVQIDVSQICWDIDYPGTLKQVDSKKSPYVFLVNGRVDDLTSDVNPSGRLGKQKSTNVYVSVLVMDAKDGRTVRAFSKDARAMDLNFESAVSTAVARLADEFSKELKR